MFNDRFKLTEAVLNGSKTQTRRIITPQPTYSEMTGINWKGYASGIGGLKNDEPKACYYNFTRNISFDRRYKGYKVDEVVAVAQSYKTINETFFDSGSPMRFYHKQQSEHLRGWNNKMFVKANLMPYNIHITNIRIERLQDISEEDCIKEGIGMLKANEVGVALGFDENYQIVGEFGIYDTPREAYSVLIDKVSGKGTWESNPFVWVYDFELIK